MTDVNYALNILMTISEVVIVFFSFFFLLYSIGTFLKVRKAIWDFNSTWHLSKTIKTTHIYRKHVNWCSLYIFGIQLGLVFSQFFLLVTAKITHVRFIFILAYKRHYFNYHHLSRTLYSRIIFYTNAHSYEKSCTSLKEGTKQKKEKHLCSSLYLVRYV